MIFVWNIFTCNVFLITFSELIFIQQKMQCVLCFCGNGDWTFKGEMTELYNLNFLC
jgi:hypothetical protein